MNKKILKSLLIFTSACALFGCNQNKTDTTVIEPDPVVDPVVPPGPGPVEPPEPDFDENGFLINDIEEEFDIHTELQNEYLNSPYSSISGFANGTEEKSKPRSLKLTWDFAPESYKDFTTFEIQLSDNENFENPWLYETRGYEIEVKNLKVDTTYSWKVLAKYKTKTVTSKTSTFTTCSKKPRNIDVGGVTNVRDLGGYSVSSGKKINQGLIYRCGRLDTDTKQDITSSGISTFRDLLKVKTEIDLRNDVSKVSSVLGNSVTYYNFGMMYNNFPNGTNMATANDTNVLKTFRAFANEANYPIIYHCNIGTDRTGMITVLLYGLLGLNMDDIIRDYLFSNFANIGGSRQASGIDDYTNYIKSSFDGDSFSEKVENFLVNRIGITSQEIQSIKNILLK